MFHLDWKLVLFCNRMYVVARLLLAMDLPILVISRILKYVSWTEGKRQCVSHPWKYEILAGGDEEIIPTWLFFVHSKKERPWADCVYFRALRSVHENYNKTGEEARPNKHARRRLLGAELFGDTSKFSSFYQYVVTSDGRE